MTTFRSRRKPHTNATISPYLTGKPEVRQATPTHFKKVKPVKRLCLSCDQPFKSEGIQNRVCEVCKSHENWRFEGEC